MAREISVCGTTTGKLLNVPGQDERYIRGEISGSTTTSVAYLTDALGSTVALAKNGAAQTFYGYDPFGVQATPTGVADSNPYAFTGAQLDVTGLQYQRHRYYSPALGRFISEDPLGLDGGINRYAYSFDSPIAFSDPLGLISPGFYIAAGYAEAAIIDAAGLGPEDLVADAAAAAAIRNGYINAAKAAAAQAISNSNSQATGSQQPSASSQPCPPDESSANQPDRNGLTKGGR